MHSLRRSGRVMRDASFRWIYPYAPALHDFFFFKLRRFIASGRLLAHSGIFATGKSLLFDGSWEDYSPLVSIIVPCYNHAPYLEARLASIANQTYRKMEVILLDDASTDDSAAILRRFVTLYPSNSRLVVNRHNSGSPFQQWQRGMELASGDLIWIAESDDFCHDEFLEALVPCFRNRGVMLAFGNTRFCDQSGQHQVWSMQDYLHEWRSRYLAQTLYPGQPDPCRATMESP